jgi:hypothetical protein
VRRTLNMFLITIGLCLLNGTAVLSIFMDFKLAFIISGIFGLIFSLFAFGFTQRVLRTVYFEINSKNKDSQKALKWYEERVRTQVFEMGFKLTSKEGQLETYLPRALYRVYEPSMTIEVNPYFIGIKASRLMVRLISTYVEIELSEETDI